MAVRARVDVDDVDATEKRSADDGPVSCPLSCFVPPRVAAKPSHEVKAPDGGCPADTSTGAAVERSARQRIERRPLKQAARTGHRFSICPPLKADRHGPRFPHPTSSTFTRSGAPLTIRVRRSSTRAPRWPDSPTRVAANRVAQCAIAQKNGLCST